MPFFSVIIPLFNKENYIENTLKSVLNQDFTDYEIIIIDDSSTDNSLAKVTEYKNDKITLIQHEKNKGLSASRNTGIRASKANYVAFLDADDIWKPNYLSTLSSLIHQFPEAHLFATNYEEIYPNEMHLLPENSLKQTQQNQILPFFENSLSQPLYCPSSLCVEKSVFEKVGYYNEGITFGEDIDFNIRANANFKLAYATQALVSYSMFSENQITNSSIVNKVITDFDQYENYKSTNPAVKKYLDFNRYIMAMQYKMVNEKVKYNALKSKIAPENITLKQQILLNAPLFLVKMIKQIKQLLLKKGIRVTSYN